MLRIALSDKLRFTIDIKNKYGNNMRLYILKDKNISESFITADIKTEKVKIKKNINPGRIIALSLRDKRK
jgi:hypothetical protein